MAKPSRPCSLVSSLRSDSNCRLTAVEDSASPKPITSEVFQWCSASRAMPPSASAVSRTCRPPAPNTGLRITRRRDGDNSRPMTNSIITTPISAASRTRSASRTSAMPSGPSTTPATR